MRRAEFIAKQGRHPTGLLGSLIARIMAVETAPENDTALKLLELQPGDQVLEVGFGHGRTIARAAAMVREGLVAGVDASERMVRMATRFNRKLIQRGRVELHLADTNRLPYPDGHFNKVYSVHTLCFWDDPGAHLRETRRVMKADARLLLGFRAKDQETLAAFPSTVYRFYTPDEVRSLLEEAGYGRVRMEELRFSKRTVLFAVAHRVA